MEVWTITDKIKNEIFESSKIILDLDKNVIKRIADVFVKALKDGKKLIFFGNGGSAADAQHLAAELSGKYLKDRGPLSAISLSSNISVITAIGNDYSYDDIFARQLRAIGKKGDVAVGISTSGNSSNVLKAVNYAKENGIITVGFTGKVGKLKDLVEYPLIVNSKSTPRIQEGYMVAGHIICGVVERDLYG